MSSLHTSYLTAVVAKSAEEICREGFAVFHHALLPRLLEAGKVPGFDRQLLAQGWVLAGQVYGLTGAPLKAQQCFRKALAAEATHAEALHQLSLSLKACGRYNEAFEKAMLLTELFPDELEYHYLRQAVQDAMVYDEEAEYTDDDYLWQLNEMLANEQFNQVINAVLESDFEEEQQLRCLARAFGAVSHHANCLQTWETIRRINPEAQADCADLFYLPQDLQQGV